MSTVGVQNSSNCLGQCRLVALGVCLLGSEALLHALLPGSFAFKPPAWKCCLAVTPLELRTFSEAQEMGRTEDSVPLNKGVPASCHKAKAIKSYFLLWLNILIRLPLPFSPDLSILGE